MSVDLFEKSTRPVSNKNGSNLLMYVGGVHDLVRGVDELVKIEWSLYCFEYLSKPYEALRKNAP